MVQKFRQKLETIFLNRRAMVIILVGALLALLIAYNLAGWLFLTQIENSLDQELGQRLQSIAELTAQLLERDLPEGDIVDTIPTGSRLIYRLLLNDLRRANQLQGIYLIGRDTRVLVSSPEENFAEGELITYLQEDSTEVKRALAGFSGFSRLHDLAGNKFKSGYAPVRNFAGNIIAIVVVEAAADFFSILDNFQNSLFIGIFISAAVVILFGFFIGWAVSFFVRLQESNRRNERLAAMGQMAATVAHEIRNPLSIIKSTAEVLRETLQPKNRAKELFEFIPAEVDRLNRLVSDFLAFARDKELQLERADLIETIGTAVEHLRQEYNGRPIELVFTPEQQQLQIRHSPDAIHQAILNLVMNAIQAMDGKGRVEVRVQTEQGWGRRWVEVQVVDTGPGVTGDAAKIFEPFYTTKTSGSGLGLSITKQIIEKHGGRIEAENQSGGGLLVKCVLPM